MFKNILVLALLLAGTMAHADECGDFDRSNRDQYSVAKWESILSRYSRLELQSFYQEKQAFLQRCPNLSDFSRTHLRNAMRAASSLFDQPQTKK